jgi:hypothetical protein
MKSIRQEKIYVRLFRTWQMEHKQANLNKIPDKECFMKDLQDLIQFLKKLIADSNKSLFTLVYEKTIQNIRFMVSDLLDLRQEKILKATRNLVKLDENLLLSMENGFYRQSYTAFKGYSKSTKLLVNDILINGTSTISKSSKRNQLENENSDLKTPEIDAKITSDKINQGSHTAQVKTSDLEKSRENISPEKKKGQESGEQRTSASVSKIERSLGASDDYIALRIIHSVEALVGEDLKIYGPLEPGNFVFLPKINGQILIEEHYATPIISNNS